MKLGIEKVPEGIKLTITYDTSKKPVMKILTPAEFEMLVSLIRTGMSSTAFKFEYQG